MTTNTRRSRHASSQFHWVNLFKAGIEHTTEILCNAPCITYNPDRLKRTAQPYQHQQCVRNYAKAQIVDRESEFKPRIGFKRVASQFQVNVHKLSYLPLSQAQPAYRERPALLHKETLDFRGTCTRDELQVIGRKDSLGGPRL